MEINWSQILPWIQIGSIGLSLVGLIISTIALSRSHNAHKENVTLNKAQIKLEEITANLSKKQLEIIEKKEQFENSIEFSTVINQPNKDDNMYRLITKNIGGKPAYNVFIDTTNPQNRDFRILQDQFPFPVLKSNDYIKTVIIITIGEKKANHEIEIKWSDENEKSYSSKQWVSWV